MKFPCAVIDYSHELFGIWRNTGYNMPNYINPWNVICQVFYLSGMSSIISSARIGSNNVISDIWPFASLSIDL